MLKRHEAQCPAISRFDSYRFDAPSEWEDAGFRDVFATPGLLFAQWPRKAAGVLPPADLVLMLRMRDDDSHKPQAQMHSARGLKLLELLA